MMNKKYMFVMLGMILLIGIVIAPELLTVREDIPIVLSIEDSEIFEERNITNITYDEKLNFEEGKAIIIHNKKRGDTFNFIKEVKIIPFTNDCVSWNVSFIDESNTLQSSIESSPEFNDSFLGVATCVNNPRLNKTLGQRNDEYKILIKEEFEKFARIERQREATVIEEPVRAGDIIIG